MAEFQQHIDPDVNAAIIRLTDALCSWERSTSRNSFLLVEEPGFRFRAFSGKPITDSNDDLSNEHFVKMISNQEGG